MTDTSAAIGEPAADPIYKNLLVGDLFPSLSQDCAGREKFAFQTMAGRYQLFGFFLSAAEPEIRGMIDAVMARRDLFDDEFATFVGVSVTRGDRDTLKDMIPGYRFAWDLDRSMSEACGATPLNWQAGKASGVARRWILVDPSMHILRIWPMRKTAVAEVIAAIEALPPPGRFGGLSRPAPVLVLPNVLEPELCRRLIDLYEHEGGVESGVFRTTSNVLDASFKRRRDVNITDEGLRQLLNTRLARRVRPMIEKLFFMQADYVERHIVSCYSAEDGGHFSPHTDNSSELTAHRRFAVSINLCDTFEGGEVVFPEYNPEGYKAPPGWAVVFPCAILHAVKPVTSGARYAFLPFVYDDGGARIRDENFRNFEESPAP